MDIKNELNDIRDNSKNIKGNFVSKKIKQYKNTDIYNEAENVDTSNYEDKNMEKKLNEKYNEFELYEPRIDVIFDVIFRDSNSNVAKSLVNAILPREILINEISFIDPTSISIPVALNKRVVVVDLNYRNKIEKRSYLIEMNIHKKYDMILRAEFNIFRIFNETIEKGKKYVINEKVSSINFIFYNMFANDLFYHRIIPKEDKDVDNINGIIKIENKDIKNVNKKINSKQNNTNDLNLLGKKNSHKKEVIVIELIKLRKRLNKNGIKNLEKFSEEIEKDRKNIEEKEKKTNKTKEEIDDIENGKKDVQKRERILQLYLWLAFLSETNMIYEIIDQNNDQEKKNEEKYEKKYDEYGNDNKNKKCITIRNELNLELYKLFKKYNEIMEAIEICRAPINDTMKEQFIEYISKADEFYYINKHLKQELEEIDKELEEKNKENKRQRKELEEIEKENKRQRKELEEIDKKLEEKNKENKRQRKELEEKDKENKRQRKELEEIDKENERQRKELERLRLLIEKNKNKNEEDMHIV